jgi:hypothetical protein
MATPSKSGYKVICVRSGNDQPQARRLFGSTHRAKVLRMPRMPGASERDPRGHSPVDDRLFNTDRLAWALSNLGIELEQYMALRAVRDSFSSGCLALPFGMDQVLRGLERKHMLKSIAHGCCPVVWQLTMVGEAMLEAIDIMLGKGPPPPKPTHRAVAFQRPRAVAKRAA